MKATTVRLRKTMGSRFRGNDVPLVLACVLSLTAAFAFAEDPTEASLPELKGEAKARIQNLEQNLTDWDVEGAKADLAALEKLAPHDVEPVQYFRGRIAFEEGRYADAVEALQKAGLTDKPGSWLRLAKDTQRIVEPYDKVESAHFIFQFPKGKDAILAPWALDALENMRAALENDLGFAPPEKIRIEIVANAGELSKVSTLSKEAIRTTGTIAICKFNKLMVTSPKAVIQGYDWLDTVSHEFVHLVVSRKSRNTVPIWMHEGLAKYLESRWRGPAGGAMTPSTLALMGSRVRKNQLVPFEKMHPSMALLPTAEDAATAFAEVFFAIKLIDTENGQQALKQLLAQMEKGVSDRSAVESVTHKPWPDFEKSWMAYLRKQPFPKDLIPVSSNERKELAEGNKEANKKKTAREISFGDFVEITNVDARRSAHLGELMRERGRMVAAVEQFKRAHDRVGDSFESLSNKYALCLMEVKDYPEAETVLKAALAMHPGSAPINVHLGRLSLRQKNWPQAKTSYLAALAVDPFDEEVQVGLYRAADALKDTATKGRAESAAMTLMNVKATELPELAARLAREEPVPTPQSVAAVDSGVELKSPQK